MKAIDGVTEAKNKKPFASLVDDVLVKRPYTKNLFMAMLANTTLKNLELTKIATACLKNLIAEDFMQLYQVDPNTMAQYEQTYKNVVGTSFNNEVAKVMMRYKNEGKPDESALSARAAEKKQVRFEEKGASFTGKIGGASLVADSRI